MKTTILVDLAISIGAGVSFLGQFEAKHANVALLSGESGKGTIQETARRIARAKGIDLAETSIFWGFTLPQLASELDLNQIRELIRKHNIDVLCIDPAYLCLLSGDTSGKQASNLFDTGPLLLNLSQIGEETETTVVLCHHCRKFAIGDKFERYGPPELEDLSMAGFAEWARQWVLLGRREQYQQGTGEHRLWLNVGGSAGFSGCWGLDINEGVIDDQFGGRTWNVSVNSATNVRADRQAEKERKRLEDMRQTEEKHKRQLREVMKEYPDGETANVLSGAAKLNRENFEKAISYLDAEGRIDTCEIQKHNGTHPGYKLK